MKARWAAGRIRMAVDDNGNYHQDVSRTCTVRPALNKALPQNLRPSERRLCGSVVSLTPAEAVCPAQITPVG